MRCSQYKISHVHDVWRDYNSRGRWTIAESKLRCVLKIVSIPCWYFIPRLYLQQRLRAEPEIGSLDRIPTKLFFLYSFAFRFPSYNNNSNGHKIAVICSQCFSHMFVQQADSVPTKNSVYKFIALTNSYQPYLIHMDEMPRMEWIKWDVRMFLEKLLVAPKLTCTSPTSPASPSITMMR